MMAYYPNVQTCPEEWERVAPTQEPGAPQALGPYQEDIQEQEQKATAEAKAQADAIAAANAKEDHQQRAIKKAESRGYQLIQSVDDLILDGEKLANENAKIQITAMYKEQNGVQTIFDSYVSLALGRGFPVLVTSDAQRDLRKFLMDNNCDVIGCSIDVGGHVTTCPGLSFAGDLPCLHVEVGIVYRPGD
jgi:hypothetical protein